MFTWYKRIDLNDLTRSARFRLKALDFEEGLCFFAGVLAHEFAGCGQRDEAVVGIDSTHLDVDRTVDSDVDTCLQVALQTDFGGQVANDLDFVDDGVAVGFAERVCGFDAIG